MLNIGFSAVLVGAFASALAGSSGQAHAQPAPQSALSRPDEARPWAVAVADGEQAIATALYVAGNHEFTESHFAQALAKYKEAIQHWDHPAIRYNMAICLINLDQTVEARDNLERSLLYGPAPLGADVHAQGLTYRKLLDAQLGHVKIACREPGAEVTLDGKFLFTAPGAIDQVLLPGEHQVIATRPGFLTASKTLILVAGKLTTYDVPTLELKPTARIVRRWDPWKPWAVLAGAGAVFGLGAASYYLAKRDLAAYDVRIARQCPTGCNAAERAGLSSVTARLDRANIEQAIAFTLFSAGGAAAVTAVVGLILNQPRVQLEVIRAQPIVTPVPGGATASVVWSY